ncbi:hypothetical protein GRC12_28435 [Streptomyces griseorubiginosus]|nr:hypothetical protein [Streptomyces griseorubiginosus]
MGRLSRVRARGPRPGRRTGPQLPYRAASAVLLERHRIGVNQVLAVRTSEGGASGMPLRARTWGA